MIEGSSLTDAHRKTSLDADGRGLGTNRATANNIANDRKKTVTQHLKSSPRWSMGKESQPQLDHHAPPQYASNVTNKEKRSFFDTT